MLVSRTKQCIPTHTSARTSTFSLFNLSQFSRPLVQSTLPIQLHTTNQRHSSQHRLLHNHTPWNSNSSTYHTAFRQSFSHQNQRGRGNESFYTGNHPPSSSQEPLYHNQRLGAGSTERLRDKYEQSHVNPNENVDTSRFLKWYGKQRSVYGHEVDKNPGDSRELFQKFGKKPKFLEKAELEWGNNRTIRHWMNRLKSNRTAQQQVDRAKAWRHTKRTMVGLSTMAALLQFGYDTDAGWRGIMFLGSLVILLYLFLPIFLILVVVGYVKLKWKLRTRKKEQQELLAKYTQDADELTEEKVRSQFHLGRLASIEAQQKIIEHLKERSIWREIAEMLRLNKKNTWGNDVLQYVEIDPDNFDPKEFLVKKFPGFEWTQTSLLSAEKRRALEQQQNDLFPDDSKLAKITSTTSSGQGKFKITSSSEFASLDDQLEGFPMLDGPELQREMLDIQKAEAKRIRDGGPKSMLDYMIARLQVEQDELYLDRDVISMNIERIMELIQDNIERYQGAVRRQKSGHIVQRFEEVIQDQRHDLQAFIGELQVIDQRGWELSRRLTVLHQSLHNAVYSNVNGIDHPVVTDIISSDIQQVIFGHIPSDLLDQKALREFSILLVPLQKQFIQGAISLEQARAAINDQFQYFFPEGYQINVKLPPISRLSGQNRSVHAQLKVQHVLEPLIDEGGQTQLFIDVAVDDYNDEWQNKFEDFDQSVSFLTDEKKAQIRHEMEEDRQKQKPWYKQIWDGDRPEFTSEDEKALQKRLREEQDSLSHGIDEMKEKMQLRALRYKTRREELLKSRQEKQIRFEISKELDKYGPAVAPASKRTLGSYGKDTLSKFDENNDTSASQMLFSVPLPPKSASDTLFMQDGSFVGGYAEELQAQRDKYEVKVALEREKQAQIESLKKRKEQIVSTAAEDSRIIHQLETDRIAFGTPIVLQKDKDLEKHRKTNDFLEKMWLAPKQWRSKEEMDKVRAEIDSRPSFWSGSMFQHDISDDLNKELDKNSAPGPSAKLVVFKKLLNALGIESTLLNKVTQIIPSSVSSRQLEIAKEKHLWKEMQKEELLTRKFFSTVHSTLSSSSSASQKTTDFAASTFNENPNWHLDVDIDNALTHSFRAPTNAKQILRAVLPASLENMFPSDDDARSKHTTRQYGNDIIQSAGLRDITGEFTTIFPEFASTTTNVPYNPSVQLHQDNPLMNPLPDRTKNDEDKSWFGWLTQKKKSTNYEDSDEFRQLLQATQANAQQSKWSLSFDDIQRLENQSQYELLQNLVFADDLKRQKEIDTAFEQGKQNEILPRVTKPDVSIEDLRKQKISRGWGK